ncbi:peptidase S9 [Putridiphycobacter roseus]|uniref:Peptidase S9 n=1 Tax=Putridiphycobacter roseus TaxID=2219161 RepID=A0A2W1N3C3_9FLAO|nr:S9 family peptidase [Putridiphycobacter roseus]PZE18817.1 peptidase S9 [Putridiphycobacter roseus]
MKSIILAGLLIVSSLIMAQNRMTPELLWKLKRVSGVAVSPDYNKVLFTQRSYDLRLNSGRNELIVLDLVSKKMSKITGIDPNFSNATWRPDGEKICFKQSDKNGINIYEVNVDGTDLRRLSSIGSRMQEFKYSPDGKRIMFTQEVKLDKFHSTELAIDLAASNAKVYDDLMYRHWSSYEDGLYNHILFSVVDNGLLAGTGIDIMPYEKFDTPSKPFSGLEQACFSPDGSKITYSTKKLRGKAYAVSTNSDIYTYDVSTQKTSNISEGMMGYDTAPTYSKDGKYLAWLSMTTNGFESDKNDIVVYDMETKTRTNLTAQIDLTVSDIIWGEDNKKIYFRAAIEATYQFFELDVKTKTHRQITKGDHNYTSIAFAGKQLIGGKQSMNHPTDVYAVDIASGKETQLTDVNKEIYDTLSIGNIEKRWVKTSDGKQQLVWIIYPPDFDKNKKYPALLYCQGGPQSAVSQFFSYRWNFQLMAANDYIIIAPNRRGLPGFGQEWNDAISQDWGGQAINDYISAVDELKKEPFIDEKRIGAVGASYGGYSVYYLAGMHENRFACFIAHAGLFNLESWYGTTEELFFANHDIGGPYYGEQFLESYVRHSPNRNVHKWDTPMLIFQGEKDYRVPVGQGLEAFQALQVNYIPSKLILFPEENHWILSPQNGVFWHRQYYAWLGKYLK